MARRRSSDLEFGSDSFLDIVANVVGILIILIVIAAVKVSRAPVTEAEIVAQRPELAGRPEPAAPQPTEPIQTPHFVEPSPAVEEPIAESPAPPEPNPAPAIPESPSEELVEQARELDRRHQAAIEESERQKALVAQSTQLQQRFEQEIAEADAAIQQFHGKHESNVRETVLFEGTIDEIAGQIAAARRQLEALEKSKPPAQQIKHRVTPVGRMVTGEEMHFHLANNRVAVVPLEELVERLRSQVSRQKEWLAKYNRHQGEVGPVGGFMMRYVVEREEVSVIEDLQQGIGTMRIGVSQWQLRPEPDLKGETAERALKAGSAFQRALKKATPGTTLTFWVYPDSFGLYRDLTQHAHLEGFTVAARPLPAGLLIAGSPQGTRSTGQ